MVSFVRAWPDLAPSTSTVCARSWSSPILEWPLPPYTREARAWARRWDELSTMQIQAEAFMDGMNRTYVEPVSDEQWASLQREGRAVCRRLQEELGEEWVLGWVE